MLYLNLPELLTKPGAKTSPTTTSDSLVLHHKHRLIVEGCKVNADLLTRREHLQILRNNLVRLVVVAHRIHFAWLTSSLFLFQGAEYPRPKEPPS